MRNITIDWIIPLVLGFVIGNIVVNVLEPVPFYMIVSVDFITSFLVITFIWIPIARFLKGE